MRCRPALITVLVGLSFPGCGGTAADGRLVERAVRELREGSPAQKVDAIALLVSEDTRSDSAIAALRHATTDSLADVRARALRALADLFVPTEMMRSLIRRALLDSAPGMRFTAVDLLTLDRYRDQGALTQLREALRDSSAALRATAVVAIGRLGEAAKPALGDLARAARDRDEMVQHEAKDAIDAITKTRRHRP